MGKGEPFLAASGSHEPVRLPDAMPVRLWHPAGKPIDAVIAWRELLERTRIVQPFKQAHREVYLLTAAERKAVFASPRFAGHLLRQHTLRALCDASGWTYRLQGPFDPARNPNPTLRLPRSGLVAELHVEAVEDEALESEHGIFLYAQTGTLTFHREPGQGTRVAPTGTPPRLAMLVGLEALQPVPLADVPPLTLSDVLRDVDLFVSLAGVAADPRIPTERARSMGDDGRERAHDELTPLGLGRRELLARIIPALPIAAQLELKDRFIVVRDKRHTYRIHLGSANVMLEPGSRHLCITAGASGRRPGEPGYVWLPFEGDNTLSLILSKAMMLANDEANQGRLDPRPDRARLASGLARAHRPLNATRPRGIHQVAAESRRFQVNSLQWAPQRIPEVDRPPEVGDVEGWPS